MGLAVPPHPWKHGPRAQLGPTPNPPSLLSPSPPPGSTPSFSGWALTAAPEPSAAFRSQQSPAHSSLPAHRPPLAWTLFSRPLSCSQRGRGGSHLDLHRSDQK